MAVPMSLSRAISSSQMLDEAVKWIIIKGNNYFVNSIALPQETLSTPSYGNLNGVITLCQVTRKSKWMSILFPTSLNYEIQLYLTLLVTGPKPFINEHFIVKEQPEQWWWSYLKTQLIVYSMSEVGWILKFAYLFVNSVFLHFAFWIFILHIEFRVDLARNDAQMMFKL